MESDVGNPATSSPERRATPEPAAGDGRRCRSASKTPPEDDASRRGSPGVREDSLDDPERRKLMSAALQQEDEFLEYLMSLPAAKERQDASARQPIFARSASTYSGCSSAGAPKVGLDHLDNLCKLMEQLGELREQNCKLQRRVQYLEDMKNLQEMHRQLQEAHRRQGAAAGAARREDAGNLTDSCLLDGSDESLPRSRFAGGKAKTRHGQPPSQHQRGRSRSVGVEDGQEEPGADDEAKKHGGGRAKRRDKSRQRRSLAAAGEVATGAGGGKAKVSKWTKVKEAFRWEKAAASVLPEAKSADSGLGGVSSEDARYLRVPPPGAADHSSPADSALSGHSSSACSSAGGQSPGLRLGDFTLPPLDTLSSSSSSEDLDLTFSDILRELGPQRSASVADSRASARDARRHSLSQLAEEEDASRRSKSLDGDVTLIATHFSSKDGLAKVGHGGKPHKTPWGKVKDIIQTRKDSLKRRPRGKTPADHEDDPYASADLDPPSSPGDTRDEPPQDAVVVGAAEGGGRRQQPKMSTCSLGSHPLALEPPPASRRLTPTLTITLPSTEELRSAAPAVADAKLHAEDRWHKTSTASAPGAVEDVVPSASGATSSSSSESNRRQVPVGRPNPSSTGTSPPAGRRAASKWTKVKKAFLTSGPGKRADDGSAPSSPNRHSSFSYDVDADELSSGEFTEAAAESGDAAPSPPQPPPLPPRQVLQAEVQRNYEQLQQKLSIEFHRKLSEWERIKTAAPAASSPPPPASSSAPAPAPDDGFGGGNQRDKSFRRKLEEWERLRGRGGAASGGDVQYRRILLHEDNLSADFRKKLHEWHRIKEAGAPKKRPAPEWQLWRGRAGGGEDQGWDEEGGGEEGGGRTPSPGVSRKNSGSGKAKRGGGGGISRGKSPDKMAARKKDLQWLEKELHKIDREKQRLEREREKFLEREARLEKMRTAMGSRPKKQEVLIQTSTGFFRFQGISEKFTRRLYEWEEARGIGPEASTFALLDPGYKPRLPGDKGGGSAAADGGGGGPLPRCKSAGSVNNMAAGGGISHQTSSLSLNDVGVLEHVETAVVVAAMEDVRASSEPHLRSADDDGGDDGGGGVGHGPRAVIVDVEAVVEETAAPLLVAQEVQGHTPVYCYAPAEVTRLIDSSSGSESDKDSARMVQMAESAGTQSSYKLIEENMTLLDELKVKEDICRQIENEIGNLEAKIDHVAKTHEEEIERLKKEEDGARMHGEGEASDENLLGELRNRILDLELRQQRLLKEGASLQESFAEQSERQAAIAQSIVGNVKQLKAASGGEDQPPGAAAAPAASADRGGGRGDAVAAVQELSSSLLALSEDGEDVSLAPRRGSQDVVGHLPALLTHKVLELKRALNQLCTSSETSTEDKSSEVGTAEEDSTTTFVVKVGRKRNVSQPIVHVDSGGNTSPVSVTITPFWKRKLQRESSTLEDSNVDNDGVNTTEASIFKCDIKRRQESRADLPDEELSRNKNDTQIADIAECEPCDYFKKKSSYENIENVSNLAPASKTDGYYETEVLPMKDASNRSGRQKKLLKTRRVSDTYMGYNRQSEGKVKLRRQNECDERCEDEATDDSVHEEKVENGNEAESKTSSQNVTAVTKESACEEFPQPSFGCPESLEGPIVSSRTTFLVHENGGRNSCSSPVNVFVPTTRKIFSPIRRDSKGKTSSVIGYVVAETPTETPLQPPKETVFQEGNKEEDKVVNIVPSTASRIFRESRAHSSSPCLRRRHFDKKEQTYRSREELAESTKELQTTTSTKCESRPLTNGVSSESEPSSKDESQKPEDERSSPSKTFPPLSPGPVKRDLNRSVSKETAPSIRLMIARYNQKLTEQEGAGGRSPDVSHSGSGSPVAWRSPATERRVRLQTEKYQQEVRKVLEHGGRKLGAVEVQKSASAGVIREDHGRSRPICGKKPPTAVVQPRGILKSSSAGAIKPASPYQPLGAMICEDRSVLPPPEEFKDEHSQPPASPLPSASPGPSSPSSPELEEPLRLRYLRLQRAKEEFLSKGPGGRSWTSEGGGSRLSQISVGSESSFEGSEAAAAGGAAGADDDDDALLVKSASAGMISVEQGAYCRLSAENKAEAEAGGGSRSRFGLAGIASRFRKVKMRRAKGRDAAAGKLNTVSMLCRQSLLVDLHQRPPPAPSSKSCPSSPVLQRSSSSGSRVGDDGAKASTSWLRKPAKIFKPKQ